MLQFVIVQLYKTALTAISTHFTFVIWHFQMKQYNNNEQSKWNNTIFF